MSIDTIIENATETGPAVEDSQIKLRSYQEEMYEESLKDNTIVVMDTGSGKTHVAIKRIQYALEHNKDKKLIWFLTGSVELCRQQHRSIADAIPYAVAGCVVGADGPDLWGPAKIWEKVLSGKDIMFSTFRVLFEALSHGHVRIQDLELLIFDEAHHAMKKGPANLIMQEFYHDVRRREENAPLPAILGLTASPTQNGKPNNVQQLEHNLNATCKTPRINRTELRRFVNRPSVELIGYYGAPNYQLPADFDGDGYEVDKRLEKVKKKVHVLIQELGWWSAVTFLKDLVEALKRAVERYSDVILSESSRRKKAFLEKIEPIASKMETFYDNRYGPFPTHFHVTDKVRTLIKYLNKRIHNQSQAPMSGIVFACQRIVVTMLQKLLSSHPDLSEMIRSGPYVGASGTVIYEKEPSELVIPNNQAETMQNFKLGTINLVVSTDALDEGIDVAACNTIVCFDEPANLRSYVQKRGRARQMHSVYVMMMDSNDSNRSSRGFEEVEAGIMRIVDEEERAAREAQVLELAQEDVPYVLRSRDTGAVITAQDARAHLQHYCAKLPKTPYVDQRPKFRFNDQNGLIFAEVDLPARVCSAARNAKSSRGWKTERAAIRDVSFQAYKKLYEHGLLTEHLLPQEQEPVIDDDFSELKRKYNHQGYKKCVWETSFSLPRKLFKTRITASNADGEQVAPSLILLTPVDLAVIGTIPLVVEGEQAICVACEPGGYVEVTRDETVHLLDKCTRTLTQAFRARDKKDPTVRYAVHVIPDHPVSKLAQWLEQYDGEVDAQSRFASSRDDHRKPNVMNEIVINAGQDGFFAMFIGWQVESEESGKQLLSIKCKETPRRRNFVKVKSHLQRQQIESDEYELCDENMTIIPADGSYFRRVPGMYFSAMRLLPSIIYQIEMKLAANCLQSELMETVKFQSLPELVKALTSPSTQLRDDYERLEFLGDTILKFHTSCQVFCENSTWHEGHLTQKRKLYISNQPLAKAAIEGGLDQFIFNEPFQGKRWSLPTEQSFVQNQAPRHLRMKIVADVMEALIGAAFLGGGMESARRCMSTILPQISAEASDFDKYSKGTLRIEALLIERAEMMVAYSFTSKYLLLEALTHPSSIMNARTESYQRLEFLGDAVLDFIVVTELYQRLPHAPQSRMTSIKAALVNGDFLAYLCYSFDTELKDTKASARDSNNVEIRQEACHISFLDLLRYDGVDIRKARCTGKSQFRELQTDIETALRSKIYPWELLSRMDAPKFVSDMIESTIGAIFVDAGGDISPCRDFLEKIGLLRQLRAVISISMDVTHPFEHLIQKCRGQKVKRHWTTNEDSSLYTLAILVDDEEVARAENCNSKDKAVFQAANEALRQCGVGVST